MSVSATSASSSSALKPVTPVTFNEVSQSFEKCSASIEDITKRINTLADCILFPNQKEGYELDLKACAKEWNDLKLQVGNNQRTSKLVHAQLVDCAAQSKLNTEASPARQILLFQWRQKLEKLSSECAQIFTATEPVIESQLKALELSAPKPMQAPLVTMADCSGAVADGPGATVSAIAIGPGAYASAAGARIIGSGSVQAMAISMPQEESEEEQARVNALIEIVTSCSCLPDEAGKKLDANRRYLRHSVHDIVAEYSKLQASEQTSEIDRKFFAALGKYYVNFFKNSKLYLFHRRDKSIETVCSVSGVVFSNTKEHNYYPELLPLFYPVASISCDTSNPAVIKQLLETFQPLHRQIGPYGTRKTKNFAFYLPCLNFLADNFGIASVRIIRHENKLQVFCEGYSQDRFIDPFDKPLDGYITENSAAEFKKLAGEMPDTIGGNFIKNYIQHALEVLAKKKAQAS